MSRFTPVLVPVLEMVMLPVVVEPPFVEICTCSTRVPPLLLPLTGVKLVTLVAVQVPVATTKEVVPSPSPPALVRKRVKKPPPVT